MMYTMDKESSTTNPRTNPETYPKHATRGPLKGLVKSYRDCFGMSPEFHGKDHPCVFPFIYRGIVSFFFLCSITLFLFVNFSLLLQIALIVYVFHEIKTRTKFQELW